MVKNICQTYLKGLKEFHFKLYLALTLASGATRPRFGVSEHPLNPQFQGLKIGLCGYRRPNYFSRSVPALICQILLSTLPLSLCPPTGHVSKVIIVSFCNLFLISVNVNLIDSQPFTSGLPSSICINLGYPTSQENHVKACTNVIVL